VTVVGSTSARIVAVTLFLLGSAFFFYGAWFASMWGVNPLFIFSAALLVVALLGTMVAIVWFGTKYSVEKK
jgi:hypothetical protein